MAVQIGAVVAKAGKVVLTMVAGGKKDKEGSSVIGNILMGIVCVLLVAAFSIIQAPLSMLGLGTDSVALGKYATEDNNNYFLDESGEVKADVVRWYIDESKRLESYAREKWSGEGSSISYPNWRWLFALDCALSDNDFDRIQDHWEDYRKYHERLFKASRQTNVSYELVTASEVPADDSDGWEFNEETGLYQRNEARTVTYWVVTFKSYKEIFSSGGILVSGSMTEEMKYFAEYESGAQYGGGWGDQGAALGFYQFDYRYGLREFLNYCMDTYPGKFEMFSAWRGSGGLSRYESGLEDSWIAAFAAYPNEFAEAQDQWAYDCYYIPAEQIAAEFGITLEGRRDCVKGLFWGLTNLNGSGGVRKYISGANLSDSMSDVELATALCEYFIAHAPQPYPESYANRYRNELETILWYLSQPAETSTGSTPSVNQDSMFGQTFSNDHRATLVNNYYKALGAISYNEFTGRVIYDNNRFVDWYTNGTSNKGSAFDGEWIYYNQGDPDWSSAGACIGSGSTIKQGGCGICSVAMIWATYSGDDSITPITVLQLGRDAGCFTGNNLLLPENIPAASEAYGLTGEWIGSPTESDWEHVEDVLDAGGCVIVNISSNGSDGYHHATKGHFLVLVGLSEDKQIAYMADPGSRECTWSEISDSGESKFEITYENLKSLVNPGNGSHPPQLVVLWPI